MLTLKTPKGIPITPQPPDELLALLHSSTRLQSIQFISGIPEFVTPLPEKGEGRNHDLALIANTPKEQITITIEAKADEPFGSNTILEYYTKTITRRNNGKPTRVPERIERLLAMVDPSNVPVTDSKWKDIRYQLLAALCGTIIQAQMDCSDLAIFVVHEFQSGDTSAFKHKQNHNDLKGFLSVLSGVQMDIEAGKMYDGFQVVGMDLMVGKVVTILFNGADL